MTIAQSIRMTADQFLQLGEDPAGIRLELANGDILVSPSPNTAHAYAVSQLLRILGAYVTANDLGVVMSDTDHILSPHIVRRPDIYFFATNRVPLIDDDVIRHPPDLAIEVISAGSENTDRVDKFEEYAAFGIARYWLVDPKVRTAEAFGRLRRKKYTSLGKGKNREEVSFPPFDNLVLSLKELWWPRR